MPALLPFILERDATQLVEKAIVRLEEDLDRLTSEEASALVQLEESFAYLIGKCLLYPKEMDQLARLAWNRIAHGEVEDCQEVAQTILDLHDQRLSVLNHLRQLLTLRNSTHGWNPRLAADVDRMEATLRQMREEVSAHWPRFQQSDLDDALAERDRGELLDVDEAFAAMAGLSVEEFRQRLEEHKRRRQALGME